MRAGKLDRQIIIQRLSETGRNALNEPISSFIDLATVWAQQRPNRGAERFQAQQISGRAMITFHIRFFPGLMRQDRIVYDGKNWNIDDIRELGRSVVMEIDATAEVD